MLNKPQNKGFVVLIAMLIISAAAIAIASSLILTGLDSSRSGFALEQSYQAKALADLCTEEALQVIHDDTGFSGVGSVVGGLGGCKYEVFDLGGDERRIEAYGTVDTTVRRVITTINDLSAAINVNSWQEVGDF